MMELYLWFKINGLDPSTSLSTILEDSACLRCLDTKRKKEAEIATIQAVVGEREGMTDFINDIKCLPCVKSEQIDAALLYLKCAFWNDVYTPV